MTGVPSRQIAAVRVLDVDRDLADALDDQELEAARCALVAPAITLGKGGWTPRRAAPGENAHIGVLVTRGILCREVAIGDSVCAELVGPGDLLRPWEGGSSLLVSCDVHWHVLQEAQLAMLGRSFAGVAARWPALTSALVGRAISRSHALALSAIISCTTGLETRLSMLFWHIADRWGKVRTDGVVVPIQMTHELIGRLIGARRPSVSTALKQLERDGFITRLDGAGWLLRGEPPRAAPRRDSPCAGAGDGSLHPPAGQGRGGRQAAVELPFDAALDPPAATGGGRRRGDGPLRAAPPRETLPVGRTPSATNVGRARQGRRPWAS